MTRATILALSLGWIAVLQASADETKYRLGIGDQVAVNVLGEAEFTGTFRVGSDGSIDYPYLRAIPVRGATTEELARTLTEKLKDGYLKDPQVTVSIKEFQSQKILIVGAVTKPGRYVLTGETKIIDALSMAGGITSSGGKRVILLRGDPESLAQQKSEEKDNLKSLSEVKISDKVEPTIIDYYGLVHQGDFSQNLVLRDGDIINIPEANEIYVLGNVAKPGPVKFEERMTIVQAITQAGGTTAAASPRSAYILRRGAEGQAKIPIRLDRILVNKEKNVILLANDVIVIPESFF